jgi:sulfate adenylyltransferase large subunit
MATLLANFTSIPQGACLEDYIASSDERPLLRVTTAGSVDDGKSTLIGRLLHDVDAVPDDQVEEIRRRSNGPAGAPDFSLLTDGLKAEREQGITIDVAYRHFATPRRRFLLADAPGHEQYTRNMATAASTADAAVVLVDVRHGLTAQSRRHARIAWMLGIRHIVIAVNKMDLAGFDREAFARVRAGCLELAAALDGATLYALPVSALQGDNVATRSEKMPWYSGPSLLELLETMDAAGSDGNEPLRFAVQCVIRPDESFRGYAGRIEAGRLEPAQEVIVMPSGARTRVKRIVTLDGDLDAAIAPMAATVVLEHELDVGRGDWICAQEAPPTVSSRFEAALVWMHEHPLAAGESLILQQGSARVPVWIGKILYRVDPISGEKQPVSHLELNDIGVAQLETGKPLAFDPYRDNRNTGSFVLIDPVDDFTLAAGMIEKTVAPAAVAPEDRGSVQQSVVTSAERFERHGHRPAVVVSRSAGVLFGLQRALFQRGAMVAVLQAVPEPGQLRDLLANGLILLAPPAGVPTVTDVVWMDAVERGTASESLRATLQELERRDVLLSRDVFQAGGGI